MNWIYHPQHAAKIVDDAEYRVLLKEGWFDSPANYESKQDVLHGTSEVTLTQSEPAKRRGRKPKVPLIEDGTHDDSSGIGS